jgi:hypothetical protein
MHCQHEVPSLSYHPLSLKLKPATFESWSIVSDE